LHIGSRKSLRGSPICNPGQDLQHWPGNVQKL
jgi:hypothetical protein